MATRIDRPTFRELAREECEAVLARNHVGRIAWAHANQIRIEPVHYVHAGRWLFGRTSPGAKLDTLGGNFYRAWPVAFEIDEVEALFRWRSVVVRGGFYALDEHGADWERAEWRTGVEQLRTLVPETFTPDDPAAFRTVLFRIAAQDVTGREATPGDGAEDAG